MCHKATFIFRRKNEVLDFICPVLPPFALTQQGIRIYAEICFKKGIKKKECVCMLKIYIFALSKKENADVA